MNTPIIQKTLDYSIFKQVDFNREKTKNHIESIKSILSKENLLHLHPILVNKDMEVIDGQHRLEAAKSLGLEIFYIQGDISYQHILNSNLFQRKLSLEDVVRFYAIKDGISDYVEFKEYLDMLEISSKALLGLLFGTFDKNIVSFIKSGKFKLPNNRSEIFNLTSSYLEFSNFVVEKRITPRSMFKSAAFTGAFRNIILLSNYEKKILFSKLENRWFELSPQVNVKSWTQKLLSIYNWKNQSPLSVKENE